MASLHQSISEMELCKKVKRCSDGPSSATNKDLFNFSNTNTVDSGQWVCMTSRHHFDRLPSILEILVHLKSARLLFKFRKLSWIIMYQNDSWLSQCQYTTTMTTLTRNNVIIDGVFDPTQKEKPLALLNSSYAYDKNAQSNMQGAKANGDMEIDSNIDRNAKMQDNSLNLTLRSSQGRKKNKALLSTSHNKVNIPQELPDENRCCSISSNQDSAASESNIFSSDSRLPGESSSGLETPRSPILPPCRICHEKASGIHYGLNTCEACKGFFRRTLKRNTTYKCSKNGKCDVVSNRRSSCAYCRFKKCLDLGMSKAAIKTGRYTHELRSKNITEVKQNALGSVNCGPPRYEPPPKDPKLEWMTEKVDEAQNSLCGDLDEFFNKDVMAAKQQKIKDRYKQLCQELGVTLLSDNAEALSRERRQMLLQDCMLDMEKNIQGAVAFCKQVPDFTKLHIDDQAALIKHSMLEIWQIGVHKCMDRDKTVITGMFSYHRDEISIVWGKELVSEFFDILECLQKLDLTRKEMGILRGLCLSFTDRVELKNHAMVEELQCKFVECFRYLTLQRFPTFGPRFSRLINCLLKMRYLNEQFQKATGEIKLVWPFIENSPIAYEVFFTH